MKILLDECIDWRLKYDFTDIEVSTIKDERWLGKKNGELLSAASQSKFDVFLTIDKKLQYQQNIKNYPIAIVVFDSPLSTRSELKKLIPKFAEKISDLKQGNVLVIQ